MIKAAIGAKFFALVNPYAGGIETFTGGALDILLLAPFILAGHGLAVTVLPRLMPDPDEASEIASVE